MLGSQNMCDKIYLMCCDNWYEYIQFHLQWRTGRTCLQYGGWYSTSRHCRHTWTLWWHKVNEFDELRRLQRISEGSGYYINLMNWEDNCNEYLNIVLTLLTTMTIIMVIIFNVIIDQNWCVDDCNWFTPYLDLLTFFWTYSRKNNQTVKPQNRRTLSCLMLLLT